MDNEELEEKPPAQQIDSTDKKAKQVTSTEKQTKPKDPGRVAAGKKVAEHNKKVREAKKKKNNDSETPINESKQETSPLSINQMISIAGITVSLVGLYFNRVDELC